MQCCPRNELPSIFDENICMYLTTEHIVYIKALQFPLCLHQITWKNKIKLNHKTKLQISSPVHQRISNYLKTAVNHRTLGYFKKK